MSNKEAHIKFDMAIQHMASDRKGSLEPEYIDMLLTDATNELIVRKINPYVSSRREGFEDSLKRYTDLQALKRTVKLEVVLGDNDEYVAILPPSFLILSPSFEADLDVDYKRAELPLSETSGYKYYTLSFPDSGKADRTAQFVTLTLTLNSKVFTLPSNYPALTRNASKFMIINYIVDELRNNGIEVGWEVYGTVFKKNTFVFYSNTVITGSLSFDAISNNVVDLGTTLTRPVSTVNKQRVPVSIFSDKSESKASMNKLYKTYCARNPIATIQNNTICFDKRLEYTPKYVYVTFLKKPRLYNFRTNAVSEIELTDEILSIAVTKSLAITGDNTYNAQLNQAIKVD